MSIHSFIHSGHFYFKSSTTQRRSRLQNGYCIGVSRRSAQATAGKGLAQGPYVTARAGVEPTTLRLRVIASTNAPSRPNIMYTSSCLCHLVDSSPFSRSDHIPHSAGEFGLCSSSISAVALLANGGALSSLRLYVICFCRPMFCLLPFVSTEWTLSLILCLCRSVPLPLSSLTLPSLFLSPSVLTVPDATAEMEKEMMMTMANTVKIRGVKIPELRCMYTRCDLCNG